MFLRKDIYNYKCQYRSTDNKKLYLSAPPTHYVVPIAKIHPSITNPV